MNPLSKLVGFFLELLRGPGVTHVVDGETIHRTFTVRYQSDFVEYEVSCKRVIHRTKYNRWWVPSIRRAVFEVRGRAITGSVSNQLERLEIFPDLSSFGLLETKYPHMRAISAYLDSVVSTNATIEM